MQRTSLRASAFDFPPLLRFFTLVAISLALWMRPLLSSFALALSDDQYTHIVLIIPICIALVCLGWKSPAPPTRSDFVLGAVLLALSLTIVLIVKLDVLPLSPDENLSLKMLALVIWWGGAFVLAFGSRAARKTLFPLCFLLWLVPAPALLLNPIVRLLQGGSAASAHLLFSVAGVPVVQEGTMITIPGLTVEVARECSSIRSSLMLIVTTMVLAQVFLRSVWKKAFVIALAIPLSVAKNGLRIFVLAMLGTRVDSSYLTGTLHRQGGIVYFLMALAIICLLIWRMQRGEKRPKVLERKSTG